MRLLIPALVQRGVDPVDQRFQQTLVAVRLPEVKGFAEFLQQFRLALLVRRAKCQQVAQHADGIGHVGVDLRQQRSAERPDAGIDFQLIAKNDLTPVAAARPVAGMEPARVGCRRGHGDGLGDGGQRGSGRDRPGNRAASRWAIGGRTTFGGSTALDGWAGMTVRSAARRPGRHGRLRLRLVAAGVPLVGAGSLFTAAGVVRFSAWPPGHGAQVLGQGVERDADRLEAFFDLLDLRPDHVEHFGRDSRRRGQRSWRLLRVHGFMAAPHVVVVAAAGPG